MGKNNEISSHLELSSDPLTDMLRKGAQDLICQTVEAELTALMEQFKDIKKEDGKAAVIRNGYLPEREIQTGIGPVSVKIPKIRSKTAEAITWIFRFGLGQSFRSN